MSWSPFLDFPREMGFEQRGLIVNNLKELLEAVNRNNRRTTVFTSLYAFLEIKNNRGVYDTAKIRQIYFDFDNPSSLECIRKLHNYCKERNLKHTMFFSGGGFHFYIAVLYPNYLTNKKTAIANAQIQISNDLNIKIGISEDFDLDAHIVGDIARLVRVPNTFNLRRKKYCIPISEEEIELLTLDGFRALAENKRNKPPFIYGRNYLDLKPFDGEAVNREYDFSEDYSEGEENATPVDIKTLPFCLQVLAEKKSMKHRERFMFISYCKEIGLPSNNTKATLKTFLDPRVFHHSVYEEGQIRYIYSHRELVPPNCDTFKNLGYCRNEKNCEGLKIG